jgi:hypothetical protein
MLSQMEYWILASRSDWMTGLAVSLAVHEPPSAETDCPAT